MVLLQVSSSSDRRLLISRISSHAWLSRSFWYILSSRSFRLTPGYPDPSAPNGYAIGTVFQQLIGSLMTLGGFLGNLMVGPLSRYLGRRHCLIIACSGCILALGLQYTSSKGAIYFARLIIGIAHLREIVNLRNQHCVHGNLFSDLRY